MSIRLHPKYGVNPTMPVCFFCGKEKGEIALLGAAYKDEAPRHMVIDYHPCDTCTANMARGITLIEAQQHSNDHPPIVPGAWPTGTWAVITEDCAKRMFAPQSVLDQVLKHRKAFIDVGVLEKMGVLREEHQSTGQEVPAQH